MNKNISTQILAFLLCISTTGIFSQGRFDVNLDIKNMHYWRGLRVSDGFVTAAMVGYYSDNFSAFAWGGLSVDGQYKEVSKIISYTRGNFSITLLDIFNFSTNPEANYFNFKSNETLHLTDLSLGWDFREQAPITLLWATIIHGSPDQNEKGNNRYSTYLEASFPFTHKETTVQPYLAAGFALQSESSIYGSNEFDLVNLGIRIGKNLMLGTYVIPVKGTIGYNPSLKQASVEIAMSLF